MQKSGNDVLQPGSSFSVFDGDDDFSSPLQIQLSEHAARQARLRNTEEQEEERRDEGEEFREYRENPGGYEQVLGGYDGNARGDERRVGEYRENAGRYEQVLGEYDGNARGDERRAGEYQENEGGFQQGDEEYHEDAGGYEQRAGGYEDDERRDELEAVDHQRSTLGNRQYNPLVEFRDVLPEDNLTNNLEPINFSDALRDLVLAVARDNEFEDYEEEADEEEADDEDREVEREESPLKISSAEQANYLKLVDEAPSQPQVRRRAPILPNTNIVLNDQQIRRLNAIFAMIPEYTPLTSDSVMKAAGALVIASIVSLTGFRVAGRYAGMWVPSNPLPLVIPSAAANIIANIFVRSTRVIWAGNTLKKMQLRWDKERMPLPDDDFIRNSIKLQGVISFIAAIPWVILVFQDLPEALWAKVLTIIFIPLLTFIVEGSLALCALTGYFDFDNQRREDAIQWKYQTLCNYRSLMTSKLQALISDEMLRRASRGEVYVPSSEESLSMRNAVGNIMAALALPYSATVGYSVYNSLVKLIAVATGPCQYSMNVTGGLLDTLFMLGVSLTSLIAGGTRFFLLSKANQNLAYQAFSYNDKPIFNVGGFDVERPAFKDRRAAKFGTAGLITLCFVIGFFSVGTASGLTLKNYFCDDGVFWKLFVSLLIGFNGAFAINLGSLFNTVMSTLIDLKKYANYKISKNKSKDRLGKTMDESLVLACHQVALMTPDQVADQFLVPSDTGFKGSEQEAIDKGHSSAQTKAIAISKDLGLFNNYAVNRGGQGLHNAVVGARKHGDGRFFNQWKKPDDQASVNSEDGVVQPRAQVLPVQQEYPARLLERGTILEEVPLRKLRQVNTSDSFSDLRLLEGASTVMDFDDDGSEEHEEHKKTL